MIWQDGAGRLLDGSFYGLNVSTTSEKNVNFEELAAYYSKTYGLEEKRLLDAWGSMRRLSPSETAIQESIPRKKAASFQPNQPLVIINSLRLYRLERPSAGGRVHCLVNNSNLSASTWRSVQIDLNCKWSTKT